MNKLAGTQEGKDMTKYTVRIMENRNKRGKENNKIHQRSNRYKR